MLSECSYWVHFNDTAMNKVLLIDDDLDMLEVMGSTLTYYGYQVITSTYTDDIFAMVYVHQPDLVILDYLIAGLNGGELCASLKRNEATRTLPVIIISAYDRIIKSLGNYGCDAFISKPFDMTLLLNVIQKTIKNSPVPYQRSKDAFPKYH
jgi:DNA-binding response OmpR family regulator